MWTPAFELAGDRAMEFAAAAIDAVVEISEDANASDIFKNRHYEDDAELRASVQKSITTLLRDHKPMLHKLFAANQGITEEEYTKNANALTVSADISGMLMDKGFRAFFGFAQRPSGKSGSAQGNTTESGALSASPDIVQRKRKHRRKKKHTGNTPRNA